MFVETGIAIPPNLPMSLLLDGLHKEGGRYRASSILGSIETGR